jgi:membrane-associated protein
MFGSLTSVISGSQWPYAIIFLLAFVDSFFPLVPSETGVIIGGVLAAGGDLSIELVLAGAAAGAFLGDNFSYGLGKVFGDRLSAKLFRGKRAQETLGWVQRLLQERGATLIIGARFIPGGRTATTFTCGLTGYRWRRFLPLTLVAGIGWALYAGLLGYLGGKTFEDEQWKGIVLALGIAGTVAISLEAVRHLRKSRSAKP